MSHTRFPSISRNSECQRCQRILTVGLDGSRDVLAQALVDIEHVKVDSAQLDDEGVSHRLAGSDVGLQDAAQLLHRLRVLQDVHVLGSRDENVRSHTK